MPALMFPIEKKFDPDAIDGKLSGFTKMPQCIQVSLLSQIAEDGMGTVTVDGVRLSRCEQVMAAGFPLLLIPVGEVAKEYGRVYRVELKGFRAKNGKKFPSCSFKLKTTERRVQDPAYAEHDEQALVAAREGMVLLKNENHALPLRPGTVLNCFGIGQHMFRISATGASLINPRWRPNFMQAVAEHSQFTVNQELADFYRSANACVPDQATLQRARDQSDTALIFLTRHSGEMQDNRPIKGQYYLTDQESTMIRTVSGLFSRVIVILNIGHPIDMRWTRETKISAILYTGFAGMLSSYALTEILDGRTNPSGRLPDTWCWDYMDSPASLNAPALSADDAHLNDGEKGVLIYYEEDLYVGYRYFDTFKKSVAYPFGYGLSYTSFTTKPISFQQTDRGAVIEVDVQNTGDKPGKEVIQVFLSAPEGRLEKPAHILVGFDKTKELTPGECQRIRIETDQRDFASFDERQSAWIMEKGSYQFFVGALGALLPCGSFELQREKALETVKHLGCPVEDFRRLTRDTPAVEGKRSRIVDLNERFPVAAPRPAYAPEPLPAYHGRTITWDELKSKPELLDMFVSQMSVKELCKLNICGGNRWAPWQDGAAGFTPNMKKYGMPSFTVSDANAGLNIKKPNIGFPASSVIAATFNRQIAWTVGRVIAEESLEHRIFLNLGPGMNLHRTILGGRNAEYFSEDPYLAGTMAGWHGKGLEENGLGCCYKHMFCNNSDLSRKGSHSIVSEQALRELYYRVFTVAFRVHKPSAAMTSYNAVNGLYPAENAALLQDLLRQEWGFDGYIMSDWDSYETIDAVEMVKAGNCWITSGGKKWVKKLYQAVKAGRVSRAVLEQNVRWLIHVLLKWS